MKLMTEVYDKAKPYKCKSNTATTPWLPLTALGTWRGTDAGCFANSAWTKGAACTDAVKTAGGVSQVA